MNIQLQKYPNIWYGWFLVTCLTFSYILSYTDRYVIYLLNTAIKADLFLTDTQMGLLMGPAFGIFYATAGIPLGILADKMRRLTLISIGMMIWSAATIACGMVKTFTDLFISRMVVGVGEACLSPAAISLISDCFPKEKRGLPIGIYFAALSFGAGISNLIFGPILEYSKSHNSIPIFGEVTYWQLTFIIVGLPGIVFALMLLILKEPKRISEANDKALSTSFWQISKQFFSKDWTVMITFYLTFGMMTIIAYGHAWSPALFEKIHGWDRAYYAKINGIVLLATAPLCTIFFGWLSDRLMKKHGNLVPMRMALLSFTVMVLSGVIGPIIPNAYGCFIVLTLSTIAIAGMTAVGPNALIQIVPANLRGVSSAFYFMTISMTGLFLGPPTIGFVNDTFFHSLDVSMSFTFLFYAVPFSVIAAIAYKLYIKKLATIQ